MKKPVLKKYIGDFYEKNKYSKLLLTKDEIIGLKNRSKLKFYLIDVFTHQSTYTDPINKEILNTYIEEILFGFKSGIIVTNSRVVDIVEEVYYEIKDKNYFELLKEVSMSLLRNSLKKETRLHVELDDVFNSYYKDLKKYGNYEFEKTKDKLISKLDKDKNGIIDIVELKDELKLLLNKYQDDIVGVDKKYFHNLVKISLFLKDKKTNIQGVFTKIQQSESVKEFQNVVGVLQNEIHTYNMILYHSLSMIISIKDNNLTTFYEIYEKFDSLRLFESNWEKDVSKKLGGIELKLTQLIHSIDKMNREIIDKLGELDYMMEQNFGLLNDSISKELKDINSSIQSNTLLNGIQTYQTYKLRK